jgi:hypothetical protein
MLYRPTMTKVGSGRGANIKKHLLSNKVKWLPARKKLGQGGSDDAGKKLVVVSVTHSNP